MLQEIPKIMGIVKEAGDVYLVHRNSQARQDIPMSFLDFDVRLNWVSNLRAKSATLDIESTAIGSHYDTNIIGVILQG